MRVEKWREDAQPERPEVAAATRKLPESNGDRDGSPGSGSDKTQVLRGASRYAGLVAGTGLPSDAKPPASRDKDKDADARSAAPRPPAPTDPALADSGPASADSDVTTALRIKPPAGPAARDERARSSAVPPVAPVRDPWDEGADNDVAEGHQHDPHEVTVQLDAVQFDGGVLRRMPAAAAGGAPEGSDGPVFVDESGRRSRRYRRIGLAVGLACAGYAVVIGATLMSGNSDAPWLPVPGQEQQPAGKVETTPDPAESDDAPGSGASLEPGSVPSAGGTGLPAPGATVLAPGATAPGKTPGTTDDDPAPTPTRKTPKPDTDADDPEPSPPVQPPPVTPDEPTPAEPPAPEPSGTTGGGDGAGTDNVAGPPAPPAVVAEGPASQPDQPAAPAPAPAAPSPEHVL